MSQKLVPIAVSLFAASALAFTGCAKPQDESDENDQSVQQAQQSAPTIVRAFTRAGGAAVTLYRPLRGYQSEASSVGAEAPADEDVQGSVETAWTDPAFVAEQTCVTYAWQGLSLALNFDQCTIPSSGQTLDGGMTLGVSLSPLGLALGFENLVLGDDEFDGTLVASLEGDPAELVLRADIALELDGGDAAFALEQASIEIGQQHTVADGGFYLAAPTATADVEFFDVRWENGECLPSSGALLYDMNGIPVTITFLDGTPTSGIVEVQVGSLPPSQEPLLAACGS